MRATWIFETAVILSPGVVTFARNNDEQEYFVKLKPKRNVRRIMSVGGKFHRAQITDHETIGDFEGVSVTIPEKDALDELENDDDVEYVEKFVPIHMFGSCKTQRNPPWGLDHIDQTTDKKYVHGTSGGRGVLVYVIDTGIDIKHREFEGRARFGETFCKYCRKKEGKSDGNGHGTHVAGIVGGKTYGVAKKAILISVKVLNKDGKGTSKDILKALGWLVKDCKKKKRVGKCVVNMSLGGKKTKHENDAVERVVRAGIPVVTAAGNNGYDACRQSPGSAPATINVASIRQGDGRSSFSNYGKCVDIFAPGERVTSASPSGSVRVVSGTSQASPHVAGAVATFLARGGRMAGVDKWLNSNGRRGVVKDAKGSKNLLLNVKCS